MKAFRKVINGAAYDTDEAELVASDTIFDESDDGDEIIHALYWSNDGRWFQVTCREDGAAREITALTREGAILWCRAHGVSPDLVARYSGTDKRAQPAPETWSLLTSKWTTKAMEH
jgi:hypothetical protein